MREKPILVTKATLPPMEEFIKMLEPIWESAWLTNMGTQHKKLESMLLDYQMGILHLKCFCKL